MAKEVDVKAFWPEWEIEKLIGRGSYGAVYRARKDVDGALAYSAIKVISIPFLDSEIESMTAEGLTVSDSITYYKQLTEDIIKEVSFMESCKGDSNIVDIQDYKVVEEEGKPHYDIYIRMELLTPLNTYLCDKTLTEEEVIKLGTDICNALTVCEKRNIIHRDIKPENIFVNEFGDYKLGDFGIARSLEAMTFGFSQKGTFNYMAPEVFNSSFYDSRADQYSLGIVLYKLLNHNRLPFLDTEKQLLSPTERRLAVERRLKGDKIPPINGVSKRLSDVITKVCSYKPEDRYTGAALMKEALVSTSDKGIPEQEKTTIADNTKTRAGLSESMLIRCLAVSAIILLLAVVSLTVLAWKKGYLGSDNSSNAISEKVLKSSTESDGDTDWVNTDATTDEKQRKYEDAKNLIARYDYKKAAEVLAEIADYKDSRKYLEEVNKVIYANVEAVQLNFEKAYGILSRLELIETRETNLQEIKVLEAIYDMSKAGLYESYIPFVDNIKSISKDEKDTIIGICKVEYLLWVAKNEKADEVGKLVYEVLNDDKAQRYGFKEFYYVDERGSEGFRGSYKRPSKRARIYNFKEDTGHLSILYCNEDDDPDYYYLEVNCTDSVGRDCWIDYTVELAGEVSEMEKYVKQGGSYVLE